MQVREGGAILKNYGRLESVESFPVDLCESFSKIYKNVSIDQQHEIRIFFKRLLSFLFILY